jgi:peptidoglycan/xylan/chitin deacetylase (PgdA/CDA1 family)
VNLLRRIGGRAWVSLVLAGVAAAAAVAAEQPRVLRGYELLLQRGETAQRARLLRLGTSFYCGRPTVREVAITFDDGPGPRTHAILTLLRHAHSPATFFEIGVDAERHPKLARAEARAGEVGDHTLDHKDLVSLKANRVTREIAGGAKAVAAVTGRQPLLFRPPYDATDARVSRLARQAGLLEVLWSVDTRDWQELAPVRIHRIVRAELRPGAIVLLHEQARPALTTLAWLLRELPRRHLRPVTVSKLLADAPPTMGQLHADRRGRACVEYPYRGPTARSGGRIRK